jgi:hypothetical protein
LLSLKVLRKFHPKFFLAFASKVFGNDFCSDKEEHLHWQHKISVQFPSAIITNKKITIAERGPFDKEKQLPLVNFGIIQFKNNF